MSRDEIASIVTTLSDVLTVLRDADPEAVYVSRVYPSFQDGTCKVAVITRENVGRGQLGDGPLHMGRPQPFTLNPSAL